MKKKIGVVLASAVAVAGFGATNGAGLEHGFGAAPEPAAG